MKVLSPQTDDIDAPRSPPSAETGHAVNTSTDAVDLSSSTVSSIRRTKRRRGQRTSATSSYLDVSARE